MGLKEHLAHVRRGDFVVEWWLWMGNAAPYSPVMFSFSSTLAVSLSPAGVTLWVLGNPASSTYAPVQTVWQHWAVVRGGTSVTLFIAGVAVASQAVAGSANLTALSLAIGGGGAPDASSPPPGSLPGVLAEFRVVLNAALYTGSFAPPTQPFDAIQGTVLLLHANSRAFSFGACCSALVLLAVELQPAGTPAVTLLGVNIAALWPPLYGSWVHMAFVRNGTVIMWYVQGKPMTMGTVPASTNFSASAASPLYIGGDTTTRAYSGLLSNFRVVVGTALYPVVFPVPASPLPAVAGTLVLLRAATQVAALVDSSGRGVVVNATGVSWNASAPTGFGGSLSFSGSIASIIAFPSSSAALGSVSRVPCMVWCPFHGGALLFCRRILLWSFGSTRRVVLVSMQREPCRSSTHASASPLALRVFSQPCTLSLLAAAQPCSQSSSSRLGRRCWCIRRARRPRRTRPFGALGSTWWLCV